MIVLNLGYRRSCHSGACTYPIRFSRPGSRRLSISSRWRAAGRPFLPPPAGGAWPEVLAQLALETFVGVGWLVLAAVSINRWSSGAAPAAAWNSGAEQSDETPGAITGHAQERLQPHRQ
ncbi:hypothetical protein [Micromonospora sp. NPDC001898]|uniref:hypothetical protein n=1 Tax=Micromonospora sp. NPDC001898 TaxID=3364221 RepID=UPI003696C954